ncbi:GUN4 domain-containing protein [Laspinema olomoucense]|uniref:GUN4 domain-containing protein n=1 Tax=Laspinema olomoucense TaxID=3231600 RepID=UPI0021BAC5A4|nr:GUN4 domain-containing protein [Laspinema sp. D3c]MCT7996954.1 GUN4 domain-containing protein [Laspinema sp. D3c]
MPDSLIIGTVNYTQLREFLNAGEWQRGDRETGRILLEIAQTSRGAEELSKADVQWLTRLDYLTEDDSLNIPCADLCLIDRLWMDSSEGHFGFTIQSQIWQQQQQDYAQFAQTVGWAVSGGIEWRSYAELIFDLSAPAGHLPAKPFYTDEGLGVGWAENLASRLDDCQEPEF